jgi:hypothetical protein
MSRPRSCLRLDAGGGNEGGWHVARLHVARPPGCCGPSPSGPAPSPSSPLPDRKSTPCLQQPASPLRPTPLSTMAPHAVPCGSADGGHPHAPRLCTPPRPSPIPDPPSQQPTTSAPASTQPPSVLHENRSVSTKQVVVQKVNRALVVRPAVRPALWSVQAQAPVLVGQSESPTLRLASVAL